MKARSLLLLLFPFTTADAQARRFTSSDAADAAERRIGRSVHMTHEIRLLAGRRLEGPAITMRLVRDDSASLMGEGLAAIKVVEEAAPGSVVVVSLDDDKSFAVFGSTFAALAKSRDLGGFVVDGAVRGLPALQQFGVPFFARGTVAGSAGGHYRLAAVNGPIRCGGVEVFAGDLIVGDEDGIAVVPKSHIPEVIAKADSLRREKEAILRLIQKYHSYLRAAEEYRKRAGRPE